MRLHAGSYSRQYPCERQRHIFPGGALRHEEPAAARVIAEGSSSGVLIVARSAKASAITILYNIGEGGDL